MISSIKQEFFKFVHQKSVWIMPLIILVLMIGTNFSLGYGETKVLISQCYAAQYWILITLVIVGSTMFSMEYQYNTILTLLYKSRSRMHVYFAKFVLVFAYDLFLHMWAIVWTFILKIILNSDNISWSDIYLYHEPIWRNMAHGVLLDIFSTMMIIGLIFVLSCLFSSNGVVITVTLLVFFMGNSFSADILMSNHLVSIMKWNPLNMLNVVDQYFNYLSYHPVSQLSNFQLTYGTGVWIVVLFGVGYYIFERRHF
ncbi:ABC transporter permease [Pediococcus pentosaceus]|uniref:ABC transporter permease n=1 Tax=Pediococcus pentosaceus TaxID=1255 RepID=UPI0021A7789E|nr:ABC transporter permease [Pediococcus pentosaceus]MCT3033279.1 ABC transporter permease [Pediococcus pentosaceus]